MARARLLIGSAVVVFVAFPRLPSRVSETRELAAQAVRDAHRILAHERWARIPETISQSFRPCEGQPGFLFGGPR
jgi:hypothetical protein